MWLSVCKGMLSRTCGPASEAGEGLVQAVPDPQRLPPLCRGSLKPSSTKNKLYSTFSLIWIVSKSPGNKQPDGPRAQQGHEEHGRYHQSKDSMSHLPGTFFSQDRSPGYAQDLINMKDKKKYKIQQWSNCSQNTCQR